MPIFISVGADIISIHVPTRGTTDTSKSHFQSRGFQSTFPRGERRYPIGHGTYCYDFNPRSHEGNDLTMSGTETGILNFNPRSHEGNDRSEVQCVVG